MFLLIYMSKVVIKFNTKVSHKQIVFTNSLLLMTPFLAQVLAVGELLGLTCAFQNLIKIETRYFVPGAPIIQQKLRKQ